MKDRRLGQAIIVIGCLLLVTQLISPVMATVFVLSGLTQLQKKPLDTVDDHIKGDKPKGCVYIVKIRQI